MIRSILTGIFSFLLIANCLSQNNKAVSDFQKNIALKNSSASILIQDDEGKAIVSLNQDKSLTPASTLKLITTATVLEHLGQNFRYQTGLFFNNNTLTIEGNGDPTLGSEHLYKNTKAFLTEWAEKIKLLKINQTIDIYVCDNLFGYLGTSPKWVREDMGNYYAAGAYGISVFDNSYRLFFNTMDTSKPPLIIRTEPEMKNISFLNTLVYNNNGKDNGYIWGEPFSNNRTLVGDIPAKRASFSIKGDIPNPGLYLGEVLVETLNLNGIEVKSIKTSKADFYENMAPDASATNNSKAGTPFYINQSPSLSEIIRIVNVKSNNHYSEHLIRTVGRENNKNIYSDPLKEGIQFVMDFWKNKNIDSDALFMYDGCGLSPSNAVSAKFMCSILQYMNKTSKSFDTYLNSLPKAGLEGTVRNFLKDTRLVGKIYVKSGSIANVQSYAGYYISGDKKYSFCIIVNNFKDKDRREVVKAIENLLLNTLP